MAEIDSSGKGDKSGKKRAKKMSTKIDMTPMVDLGFLLITFFMLTTTLAKPVTMQLNMPDKTDDPTETSPIKESETITVVPDSAKVYYFQGIPGETAVVKVTDYSDNGIREVIASLKAKVGTTLPSLLNRLKPQNIKISLIC